MTKIIRASEIASYLYCKRAWWFEKNEYIPENRRQIESGISVHERHGWAVVSSGCIRTIAIFLFLLSLILLTTFIANQLFGYPTNSPY